MEELSQEQQQKSLSMAEKMADDFDPQKAEKFAQKHADKGWIENFKTMYQMLTDKDFELSKGSWVAIAGAIAYVVSPIDVIPDFLFGVGFIDDVMVLSIVVSQVGGDIARYMQFKQEKLDAVEL